MRPCSFIWNIHWSISVPSGDFSLFNSHLRKMDRCKNIISVPSGDFSLFNKLHRRCNHERVSPFRPLWGFLFIQFDEKIVYKLAYTFRPLWGFLFIQSTLQVVYIHFHMKLSVPSGDFSLFNRNFSQNLQIVETFPSPLGISLYSI